MKLLYANDLVIAAKGRTLLSRSTWVRRKVCCQPFMISVVCQGLAFPCNANNIML